MLRFSILAALAAAAAAAAQHKMGKLMGSKSSHFDNKVAAGVFADDKYTSMGPTPCRDGKAGEYACDKVDVQASLTHGAMGSKTRAGNDIWGWTSDDGREFALVGQTDGTAFVEVGRGGALRYAGRLPTQTGESIWRDIKVIGNHAYIGAEAEGHGMQVFDLRKLLVGGGNATGGTGNGTRSGNGTSSGNGPTPGSGSGSPTFDPRTDLTAHYAGFGSSHNIIADAETNTIFAVGAGPDAACKGSRGGLIMLDVADPARPTLLGCAGDDGYVHDAHAWCTAAARFRGRQICIAYDESKLAIMDVTDKAAARVLSRTYYDGFNGTGAYTHQGWTVDADMRWLVLDDELDEQMRRNASQDAHTTTYVFDLADLTAPRNTGRYKGPVRAIDHNQYVVGHAVSYQANYASGLRVVDVAGVARDPSGASMRELAHFDCYPEDDADPQPEFNGAWSVYPWLASGTVVVNCIERGMFALKVDTGR